LVDHALRSYRNIQTYVAIPLLRTKYTSSKFERLNPIQPLTQLIPEDLSTVVPPLPIPNRTVKRSSANDSEQCACESRSSSGKLQRNPPLKQLGGGFAFGKGVSLFSLLD
jgi:hypothetical protein